MRKGIIASIFKKEMTDILRDKKTLFMMIILPIIMYPVLMIFGSQVMMMSINSMEQKELSIAFNKPPNAFILNKLSEEKEGEGKLKLVKTEDYKADLEKREIAAYIEILEESGSETYKIYMNSSVDDSKTAERRLRELLAEYKDEIVKHKISQAGLKEKDILEPILYETINTARDEEMAGYLLGQILPFILIIGVLMGAIYPAIDVMAGEKERGTLETLLTLPISNLELIMGKYLAVSVSAIVTALLNILSITGSIAFLVVGLGGAEALGVKDINIQELILPLLLTLICICLFAMVVAAISMCVCSLAKNFKEAQNYITPIMFIVMIPSYASMFPNVELNGLTATIPVVNISLLIKSVLTFRYDIGLVAVVFATNTVFMLLGGLMLSKMFNSEDILFGSGKGFSFLEKRSNIKIGTMPTVSDGFVLYALVLLLLIYIGGLLQVKFGLGGVALTQLIFIGAPLLFAYYIKADFKQLFGIKLPSIRQVLGGVNLWMGGFIAALLIAQLILYLFPQNMEIAKRLSEFLIGDQSVVTSVAVIALLPAVCEEVLYRGFLVTAFKDKSSDKRAIILSSILFGLMHIDFIRIIPTMILGLSLSYAVCKTGSLIVPMLMHFLNNGITVFVQYYPKSILGKVYDYMEIDFAKLDVLQVLSVLAASLIFIILALILFRGPKEKSKKILQENI